MKAVTAVSAFNLGEARREGMGTISYEERMKRLRDAAEARSGEARGEAVRDTGRVGDTFGAIRIIQGRRAESVAVMRDTDTGRSRGFAFVEMASDH